MATASVGEPEWEQSGYRVRATETVRRLRFIKRAQAPGYSVSAHPILSSLAAELF